MIDTRALRDSSRITVEGLGHPFNASLPLLDPVHVTRTVDELSARILVLYACIACSYGFAKTEALIWLEQEDLLGALTDFENAYLHEFGDKKDQTLQWQVEALWCLTWVGSYHSDLEIDDPCPESFVALFPDLSLFEATSDFRGQCRVRPLSEIAAMLDLSYCLNWAIRERLLSSRTSSPAKRIESQVIVERRRALEWITSERSWDHNAFDT